MDEDVPLDQLKLAFSYHVVNQVLGADGAVVPAEAGFLARTFPPTVLERSGFVASDGRFTARWQHALGEALLQLPILPVAERVAIVDTLFDAALADDKLDVGETGIVLRAARLLGLREEQVSALVARVRSGHHHPRSPGAQGTP
jgi:uncharacterized tellurite resistance protein B-like protein